MWTGGWSSAHVRRAGWEFLDIYVPHGAGGETLLCTSDGCRAIAAQIRLTWEFDDLLARSDIY